MEGVTGVTRSCQMAKKPGLATRLTYG
jgi:hypothetical protein